MKSLHVRRTLLIADVSTAILKARIVKNIRKQEPVYKDQELKEHIYSVNMDDDLEKYSLNQYSINFMQELRRHDPNLAYFRLIED